MLGKSSLVCLLIDCSTNYLSLIRLINQLYYTPNLPGVSAVIVDEVHERSVNTDLLIALLRHTLELRAKEGKHPLKIVLTSATMNEGLFAAYFARNKWDSNSLQDDSLAPVLKVGGRTFPVDIHYDEAGSSNKYEQTAEAKVLELNEQLPATNLEQRKTHDFLVFLTQADEVDRLSTSLQKQLPDCYVVPLHGSLDRDEQRKAFIPTDSSKYKRKIVISTNIAETSVTIDGIGVVIDCGMSKQAKYDPAKDATVLSVDFIAQSSAKQRAGRAGRTSAGECYRLYSKEEFDDMDKDMPAELLRIDASGAILYIAYQIQRLSYWVNDIRKFPFIEHPGEARLEKAIKMLYYLGALSGYEGNTTITEKGKKMAKMTTNPKVSAILFEAVEAQSLEIVSIAIGMSTMGSSLFRREKSDSEAIEIAAIRQQFANVFPELGDVGSCVAMWFQARDVPKRQETVKGSATAGEIVEEVVDGEPAATEEGSESVKKSKKSSYFSIIRDWCKDNFINFYALKDAQQQVSSIYRDMQAILHGPTDGKQGGKKHGGHKHAFDTNGDEDNVTGDENKYTLNTISADVFHKPENIISLKRCLLRGYFSNIGFALPLTPQQQASNNTVTTYYLPGPNAIGSLTSNSAFRASGTYPEAVLYMEVIENRKTYIASTIGIRANELSEVVPPLYVVTDEFKNLLKANEKKQLLSRTSQASTTCPAALKRFVGGSISAQSTKLRALETHYRSLFNLSDKEDILIECDRFAVCLYVKCTVDAVREAVAEDLQRELKEVETRLFQRRKEWAVPGTNVRAVITTGGTVQELLFNPLQTISISFAANSMKDRMSEPVAAFKGVPKGYFADLAKMNNSGCGPIDDAQIQRALSKHFGSGSMSHVQSILSRKATMPDLSLATQGEILAAYEYTRGPICYAVNPLLRNLNESSCHEYDSYIRGLISFFYKRSNHSINTRKGSTIVYRGCSLSDDLIDSMYKPNEYIVWPAFTSTSVDEQIAIGFAFGGMTGTGYSSVIFEIMTESYCPIHDISHYQNEREILFPCFSFFFVESVEPNRGSIGGKRIRLRHERVPPTALLQDSYEKMLQDAQLTGNGPVMIKVTSDLPGEAGIAEEIEKQLLLIDPIADVSVKFSSENQRIWGRATFSHSNLADQACRYLHTSMIGDREMLMKRTPIETDSMSLQCRVLVSMTYQIPHNGYADVDLGNAQYATLLLGGAKTNPDAIKTGTDKKKWNTVILHGGIQVSVSEFVRKSNKTDSTKHEGSKEWDTSTWVSIGKVPTHIDELQLKKLLLTTFPQFPVPLNVQLKREQTQLDSLSKELKGSGVKGTQERQKFIKDILANGSTATTAGVGGANGKKTTPQSNPVPQFIEEVSLHKGAHYCLWFQDYQTASQALKCFKSSTKTTFRVNTTHQNVPITAKLDIRSELTIPKEEFQAIKPQIDAILQANLTTVTFTQKTTRVRGKEVIIFTLSSDSTVKMNQVYKELALAQRGIMMNLSLNDRVKVFS